MCRFNAVDYLFVLFDTMSGTMTCNYMFVYLLGRLKGLRLKCFRLIEKRKGISSKRNYKTMFKASVEGSHFIENFNNS